MLTTTPLFASCGDEMNALETELEITTELRLTLDANASFGMMVIESGMTIDVNPEYANALIAMFVTESGITIDSKFGHSEKALLPRDVTELPSITDIKSVQP